MSLIMQSRASFSNWKAVGVDGISAEVSNPYLGALCRKSKKGFEIRYKDQNKEDVEFDRLVGDERNLCAERAGQVVLWMSIYFCWKWKLRNVEKRDKSWSGIHTFGFEEGRSATELSTVIRLMAAAAREWGPELGVIFC